MVKRRGVITAGFGISIISLSGCTALYPPGGRVSFKNRHNKIHTFDVVISNDENSIVFDRTVKLESNEEKEVKDAFGAGTFTVSASIESVNKQFDLNVGQCNGVILYIIVTEDGVLEVSQVHC